MAVPRCSEGQPARHGELRPSRREAAKIAEAERMLECRARKGVISVKGHRPGWNAYRVALIGKDHARRKELELRADGLAVLTLRA
jgi:hypothetical protein